MMSDMKAMFRRLVRPLLEHQVKRLIKAKRLKVVAVAGAVGKTTTKLTIAAVLQQKYRVLVHPGNFNAEIGLPLAVFNLDVPVIIINPFAWLWRLVQMEQLIHGDYPYDVLVLELGTDKPGEIPHFMTYLRPDIGVVTAVAPEHMENFANLDAVAAEELALAAGSAQVVVNQDDVAGKYRQRHLPSHLHHHTYGLAGAPDYGFKVTSTDPTMGTLGHFVRSGHAKPHQVSVALYGDHSARAVAAAYAVGDLLDLTTAELEAGLADIKPVSGRMNPLSGLNGSILIDDTYNSSPDAAQAALTVLGATKATGRRIAVMGSMNELGQDNPRYHAEVGAACAGLDLLVTVGELANRHLGPAAIAAGLDERSWKPADSPYAAGEFLKLLLKEGDVVLIKGSQNGVFCEETVKLLLADPNDAAYLVRQSPVWQRRKAEQFADAPRA